MVSVDFRHPGQPLKHLVGLARTSKWLEVRAEGFGQTVARAVEVLARAGVRPTKEGAQVADSRDALREALDRANLLLEPLRGRNHPLSGTPRDQCSTAFQGLENTRI